MQWRLMAVLNFEEPLDKTKNTLSKLTQNYILSFYYTVVIRQQEIKI